MDVASEMVLYTLPLYLAHVVGLGAGAIGLLEGAAETVTSLVKLASGWLSDRLGTRKWLAVAGYGLSAAAKPLFLMGSALGITVARLSDRVGKGVRSAPRDALIADSITPDQRGLAFGLHRAADTAGAALGLILALLIARWLPGPNGTLSMQAFQTIVWWSLIPAVLAVLVLTLGAREVRSPARTGGTGLGAWRALGRPFLGLMGIVAVFELGNSADAFLVLRTQDLGWSADGVLLLVLGFNLVYTMSSGPAGWLSDRLGRKRLIVVGWLLYALVYLGFGLATEPWHVALAYAAYGLYYGLAYGTARALIADTVPPTLRGTAYGAYNAIVGLLALPASSLAGQLWQAFSPSAPFLFGAVMALLATGLLAVWTPRR
jgi:MFS family permease